jgi:DNA-binding NtrC family response regulator
LPYHKSNEILKHLFRLFYAFKLNKISKKAIEALKTISWTSNIRELRNVIERLLILGEDEISESDVKLYVKS